MDIKLLIIFIVLNVINVIIQTIKSLATVNCGKTMAAFVNAIAYGLYTVVVVYMVCDLPLWLKVLIIAVANLIGVYIVKLFEEKNRKEKLWKIECTIRTEDAEEIHQGLKSIPHSYITITEKRTLLNCYCATKKDTEFVKIYLERFSNIKYFVSESKVL